MLQKIWRFVVEYLLPGLPIWSAALWLLLVTLPFYAMGLHKLPDVSLWGNNPDSKYYYDNIMGILGSEIMLLIWLGIYFFITPIITFFAILYAALKGSLKKWLIVASVACYVLLHIHLTQHIWDNSDVYWATDMIYDVRPSYRN